MPWVNCKITRAGPAENGIIYIALRADDGSFHRWFQAVSAMEREMLAVALSAINSGKGVTTYLTGTTAYSTINRLYITD